MVDPGQTRVPSQARLARHSSRSTPKRHPPIRWITPNPEALPWQCLQARHPRRWMHLVDAVVFGILESDEGEAPLWLTLIPIPRTVPPPRAARSRFRISHLPPAPETANVDKSAIVEFSHPDNLLPTRLQFSIRWNRYRPAGRLQNKRRSFAHNNPSASHPIRARAGHGNRDWLPGPEFGGCVF